MLGVKKCKNTMKNCTSCILYTLILHDKVAFSSAQKTEKILYEQFFNAKVCYYYYYCYHYHASKGIDFLDSDTKQWGLPQNPVSI